MGTHLLRYIRSCLLLSFFCLVLPITALGQTDELPLDVWTATADAAVEVLADPATKSEDLETFRATLSDQRGQALEAQDKLKLRVETIEGELASLGPAPEDGATEAREIAERRRELETSIAQAKVPLIKAQAAYERADGLISEIDEIVRGRLSDELTSLGPSPLNPAHWPRAATEIAGLGEMITGSYSTSFENPALKAQLLARAPFAFVLIILGLVVQFYAKPRALTNLNARLGSATRPRGELTWRLASRTVRNLLPLVAATAVILGFDQLDPRNARDEDRLIVVLIPMALMIVLSYWLGNAVFSPNDVERAVLRLEPRVARRARRNALIIGVISALMFLVQFLTLRELFSEGTSAVLQFPLFVIGGLFLARLALIIRSGPSTEKDAEDEDETSPPQATNVIRDGLSRAGLAIGIVVPVLAAVGYLSAAKSLFGPTVLTFGLIGALVAVYIIFRNAVDAWMEAGGDASSRVYRRRFRSIPLIGGLILTCLAVPVLALIWGARVSEIQEVWIWLRDGVTIGDVRLSVTDVLTFILVFAIGYTITRMIQAVVKGSVLPRMELDRGAANAIISGIGYVGIFLAAVIAISATGLSLGNLAIVAGALSVGIGFGLQAVVSNFVSGIILLVERPIKEGDWIEVAGFSGYVRKISVRSTLIDTFDKAAVIVPNSELIAGTVLNWTHSEMTGRVIVPVGVAYGENPRKVEKILLSIAEAHPMVLRRPAPAVIFMGFGSDSMDFEIRAFLRDVNWMLSAKSEMNFSIVQRFAEEGIEIPYAQRDINLRNVDQAAQAFWQSKRDSES